MKKMWLLLAVGLCGSAFGETLLRNGSFEQRGADGVPVAWQCVSVPGKGKAEIDGENAVTGKYSMRLEQKSAGVQIQAYTYCDLPKPLDAPRDVIVRFKAMGDSVERVYVVFTAGPIAKPQQLWKSIFSWNGAVLSGKSFRI